MRFINALVEQFRKTYAEKKEEIFNELSAEDHYQEDEWEKYARERDSQKSNWERDDLIKDDIDDRFHDWIEDFRDNAVEENGKIMLYRCISVDDADEFVFKLTQNVFLEDNQGKEYKGIGIYWAWDEKRADCHWGQGGGHVTVWGMVDLKSIDLYGTVIMNLNPSLGREEAEMRLIEGAPVEIYGIDTDEGEMLDNNSEYGDALMVPASFPTLAKIVLSFDMPRPDGKGPKTAPSKSRPFKLYEEITDQKKANFEEYVVQYQNDDGTFDLHEVSYSKGSRLAKDDVIALNTKTPYMPSTGSEVIHDYEFEDRVGSTALIRLIFELADPSGSTDLETSGDGKGTASFPTIAKLLNLNKEKQMKTLDVKKFPALSKVLAGYEPQDNIDPTELAKFKTSLTDYLNGKLGEEYSLNEGPDHLTLTLGDIIAPDVNDETPLLDAFLDKLTEFLSTFKQKQTYKTIWPNWEATDKADEYTILLKDYEGDAPILSSVKFPTLAKIITAGKVQTQCYSTWNEGLMKIREAQNLFNYAMQMSASEGIPLEMKAHLSEFVSEVYKLQADAEALFTELREVDPPAPVPTPAPVAPPTPDIKEVEPAPAAPAPEPQV